MAPGVCFMHILYVLRAYCTNCFGLPGGNGLCSATPGETAGAYAPVPERCVLQGVH